MFTTPKAANGTVCRLASVGSTRAILGLAAALASGSDCSARRLRHHRQRKIIPIAALVDLKVFCCRSFVTF